MLDSRLKYYSGFGLLVVSCLLFIHCVTRKISSVDEIVFIDLLEKVADEKDEQFQSTERTLEVELTQIKAIQKLIQKVAPLGTEPIPQYQSRQPINLISAQGGLCYDRAYTLAKFYRYLGWETRHVALYQNDVNRFNAIELFDRKIKSHASLEVKTQAGWLIVDPDQPWIGLATDSSALCYVEVQEATKPIVWLENFPASMNWHLTKPPIVVYGLYSRHGKFFPPYNFIPDVNWGELLYNIQ